MYAVIHVIMTTQFCVGIFSLQISVTVKSGKNGANSSTDPWTSYMIMNYMFGLASIYVTIYFNVIAKKIPDNKRVKLLNAAISAWRWK